MTELLSQQDNLFMKILLEYFLWYKEHFPQEIITANVKHTTINMGDTAQDIPGEFLSLRKAALSDTKAIRRYIDEHEESSSPEDRCLLKRIEAVILDRFILISVKKDTIHLLHTTDDGMYLLEVTPWSTDALELYQSIPLPVPVDAALFPADGTIMYDMLDVMAISIGATMAKNIKEDARVAKAMHGIITTLPIPLSDEDPDAGRLRGFMMNRDSIIANWDKIQDIIHRKPDLSTPYYQMLGGAYTRMRRKEIKDNGIYGWFAIYGWAVIAGGKARDIAEKAVQSLLPPDTYDRVVYFEVKQK